jgi:hypothetical protein
VVSLRLAFESRYMMVQLVEALRYKLERRRLIPDGVIGTFH